MKQDHGTEFVHELMGDEGKDQWLLVNPRMLIGLVGTVACYGWAFLMLGTSAFVPSAAGLILAGEIIRRLGGVD